jgi:hypothetical protein
MTGNIGETQEISHLSGLLSDPFGNNPMLSLHLTWGANPLN